MGNRLPQFSPGLFSALASRTNNHIMNRLQLAALLIGLTGAASGGLLPGDGYQYDRPAGGDFGQRLNNGLARLPAGGRGTFGNANNNGYNPRQPSGFGFANSQPGYQGYQGYQGNTGGLGVGQGYQGYQGTGQGFGQGFQGDNAGGYRGFDGGDNGRSVPRPYSFQYEVRDAASGNDYGQQESGDGAGTVRGEYRVLLPDSRTQVVRYTADDANGYVADVRYESQAQFNRPGFFNGGSNAGGTAATGGQGFFNGGVNAGYQQGRGNVVGGAGGFGPGASNGFGGTGNQYLPPSTGSYGK